MSVRSSASGVGQQLALFLSPPELTFIATDVSTYKQFITIYNPYNFNIRYKTFCTCPAKYEMSQGNGTVPAQKSVDIVVRLKDTSEVGRVDMFRFMIFEQSNLQNCLGEREVRISFLAEAPAPSPKFAKEKLRPNKSSMVRSGHAERDHDRGDDDDNIVKPNIFFFLAGAACLVGLCLPTTGDTPETWLARYVTLTVNQKLVAAFVLGMVTMVIFRIR